MVKNQSPKQLAKTPGGKPTPQSMKKGGPAQGKPTPGKPTPKQSFQFAKGGQTPGKTPGKNVQQTPKQALSFQSPKQTPKAQQTPKNKPQASGRKTLTPHPLKNKQESDDDDDDEDMESYDSIDEESDDSLEDQPKAAKSANGVPKKGLQAKNQLVLDGDEEDEDFDDEEDDSFEDESEDEPEIGKNQNGKGPKQQSLAKGPGQQGKKQLSKATEESSDDDEEFDSEDDEDEEFDSEEDDEDEEEESESEKNELAVKGSQLQKKATSAKPTVTKAKSAEQKPQAAQKSQPGKQVKRPAPQEESDEEDEDEDEEEEDDDDDEDEDEEDEDEEEEEDEEDAEAPVKQSKKGQQKQTQKQSEKADTQAQKKMKTNEGKAAVVQQNAKSKVTGATMPTKLDKKLQEDIEERKRERDRRSLFVKNLPKGISDVEVKALSPDILSIGRKGISTRWCYLIFANEQICQKNYDKLKDAKLGKAELFVDFCGEKSKSGPPKQDGPEQRVDALRLYIGNLPPRTNEAELKKHFPTAASIHSRTDRTFAFAIFDTPEKARQAFAAGKGLKIGGVNVVVSFARIQDKSNKKKTDAVKKFAKDQAGGKVVARG